MVKKKKKTKKKKYVQIQLPPKIEEESMVSKLAWKTNPWGGKVWLIFIVIACFLIPFFEILSDLFNHGLYKK